MFGHFSFWKTKAKFFGEFAHTRKSQRVSFCDRFLLSFSKLTNARICMLSAQFSIQPFHCGFCLIFEEKKHCNESPFCYFSKWNLKEKQRRFFKINKKNFFEKMLTCSEWPLNSTVVWMCYNSLQYRGIAISFLQK